MNVLEPTTCEDCLTLLTGVRIPKQGKTSYEDFGFHLKQNDATILISIARQLSKGVAMTDRQYALVKEKLTNDYADQFNEKNIDVLAISKIKKYGLREIDRSHWLRIVSRNNEEFLAIRFPFSNKIIKRVQEIKNLNPLRNTQYDKHTHHFPVNAENLFKLMQIAKRFEHKFEIQQEILDAYNVLLGYYENKEEYIPGVYDYKIKNLPDNAVNYLLKTIGDPKDNIVLYYERRYLYGLHSFDNINQYIREYSTLSQIIINRDNPEIVINNEFNFDQIISSVTELKRFPILIVLDENNAFDKLVETYNSLKYSINSEDVSVLFRLDGSDPFNEYVKQKKLNNPVAENTKIVYINSSKLPKPLIKSGWVPNCVVNYDSRSLRFNHVTAFSQQCDLQIICNDKVSEGYWSRSQRKFIHVSV